MEGPFWDCEDVSGVDEIESQHDPVPRSSASHRQKGVGHMIRLVSLLKRKPGTTHQEFLDYWLSVHGPLIRNCSASKYVHRYEQHPASWPAEGSGAREPEWDGVTIQYFDSVEAFNAHMSEPDFPEVLADTEKFLDTGRIQWILTDEPNLVIS
jgi:uncharacterized protein (TIGR02118 family)